MDVTTTPPAKIAVLLHLAWAELWPEFNRALANIPANEPFDLHVNLVEELTWDMQPAILRDRPDAIVHLSKNYGRDIPGTIKLINSLPAWSNKAITCDRKPTPYGKYDAVLLLHSKADHVWRQRCLSSVLGSPDQVAEILDTIRTRKNNIGMIGERVYTNQNNEVLWQFLCDMLGIPPDSPRNTPPYRRECRFLVGSMFWADAAVIDRVRAARLHHEFFASHVDLKTDTWGHAMERAFGTLAISMGFRLHEQIPFDGFGLGEQDDPNTKPEDFRYFMSRAAATRVVERNLIRVGEVYRLHEFAQRLGWGRSTLAKATNAGLPVRDFGGRKSVCADDAIAWLKAVTGGEWKRE